MVCKEYDCYQIWVRLQLSKVKDKLHEFFHPMELWQNIYLGNVQKIKTELVNIRMYAEKVMRNFLPLLSMYGKSIILSIGLMQGYWTGPANLDNYK